MRVERKLDQFAFEAAVVADAGGWASPAERAALEGDSTAWIAAVRRLIHETDDGLRGASKLTGELRELVLADLMEERARLAAVLLRLSGDKIDAPVLSSVGAPAPAPTPAAATVARPQPNVTSGAASATSVAEPVSAVGSTEPGLSMLQASWAEGRIVVWAGGPGIDATSEDLEQLLEKADATSIAWERHGAVPVPGETAAEARAAPIAQTLGWLVGVGAGHAGDRIAPSLRWAGEIALWGTELVAQGRMVPVVRGANSGTPSGRQGAGRHRVRWVPALVGRDRLHDLVTRMPTSVVALQPAAQADAVCRSVLAAVVDAISRAGAGRLVAPAAAPHASTRTEIAEAVLSGLDGRPFVADSEPASRIGEDLKRWAGPVTANHRIGLIVKLDAPQADGSWLLSVEATGVDKHPMPVEHALVVASGTKSQQVEAQLRRLERLLPVLRRPSTRRGQVILDGDEAVELMFTTGPALLAAGFEAMLPIVSRRRPRPQLRLFAEAVGPSQVGVQQLANVRWSVFFDDLELDAAGIAALAKEAKPLVQVRGRWVHIDRGDLAAAASALAERADITQLTGAAVIRHAVGLEGTALAGPVQVDGSGWAADLLRGATTHPPAPIDTPDGFAGQLRSYQAEAAGWLGFLDRAGLGGCLAMDMGLGKTPTLLAQVLLDRGHGPSLVICPPAVLSNWASEANRFTKGLKVAVHHGPRRAEGGDAINRLATSSDIVLTTYATAVRDIVPLSAITWRRVVVDEAQVIKNYQSETAQELRRLSAHSRIALTGTPVENGLGDLWAILDFTNPGLVGPRNAFIEHLSRVGESVAASPTAGGVESASANGLRRSEETALRALNGLLIFRRTKTEPEIAAELPDKVDKLDHCSMTPEQVGLYQAIVNRLLEGGLDGDANQRKGAVLAAITALKQVCDHPAAYLRGDDDQTSLVGRSGKLIRLEEILGDVFAAGERILIFTHFARWGDVMARHLSERTGRHIGCYHGGLTRTVRDQLIADFQSGVGPGALVLSIKAGGSGLNLTAANHVVLYDRWWNPAVEDQARDRAWRIGQTSTVMCHRLVCPGTVDERVEEIVAGKRRVAGMVLPARSSLGDLDAEQLRVALGLRSEELVEDEPTSDEPGSGEEEAA